MTDREALASTRIETLRDAALLFRALVIAANGAHALDREPPLRDLRPDSALSVLAALQWVYRAGACGDFARALSRLTGWPVVHLVDWKGPVHAACELPDGGGLVDVCGKATPEAMCARYGFRPVRVLPAPGGPRVGCAPETPRGVMRAFGIDARALAARVAVLLPYAPFTDLSPSAAPPDVRRADAERRVTGR